MKKIGIIITMILIVCVSIFTINIFNSKDNKVIEDDLGNTLAIMVSYDQGNNYSIYERKSWPTKDYKYKEAKCFDMNGKAVENVVTFNEETRKATITTNQSISCTLYFDYSLIEKLRENDPNNVLSQEEVGGMYRYQGVGVESAVDATHKLVNNNYVCFGTDDKKECVNNEDKYMYRIIGVTSDNSLKLIKKEALDKGFQWYSDDITDIKWPQSYVYQAIIGDEYLNNENYLSNDWKSKIITKKWLYGDAYGGTINVNGLELYKVETGQKNSSWYVIESDTHETGDLDANSDKIVCSKSTGGKEIGKKVCYTSQNKIWQDYIESKIGLMYVHDYYLSYDNEINCYYNDNSSKCINSWIHLKNNDNNAINYNEWTMTRYGYVYWLNYISMQGIYSSGRTYDAIFRGGVADYAVRPVFYTTNNIKIIDGTGTIDNPYIIN